MSRSRKGSMLTLALMLAGALIVSPHVSAQNTLEEVVVTALKRAENLQETPATITVFDAERIEEAGITSMRDYVSLTSNMTLMETQNNAFAFVNIRGLSQIRNVDPTVAVVVDGVLTTTSLSFSQDLYDIRQIEVLKGPQGALYGGDLARQHLAHMKAGRLFLRLYGQDVPDLRQGEAQPLGLLHKFQPLEVVSAEHPIAALRSLQPGENPLLFVEANGLNREAGGAGNIADLHGANLFNSLRL